MKKCCIRDTTQLENKIKNHKQSLPTVPEDIKEELSKVATRSKKKEHN